MSAGATSIKQYSAAQMGLDAVVINTEKTGSWIGSQGATDILLKYDYTYSAATKVRIEIDWSNSTAANKDYPLLGGSAVNDATADRIVETVRPYRIERPVTASERKAIPIKVLDEWFRVRVVGVSAGAGDKISIAAALLTAGA